MQNDTHSESTKALSKRLFGEYIAKHKGRIFIAIIAMIIAAIATAGTAYMLQPVMDEIFVNKDAALLNIIPLVLIGLFLCKSAATYTHVVIMATIGQRVVTDMQIRLYEHLLKADIQTFSDQSSGSIISRFTNDIQAIRRNFTQVIVGLAKELITLIFLVALMFYQSWELALVVFFVFPAAILPIIRLGKRKRKVSKKIQESMGEYTASLDDTFQGIRVIKTYGQEEYELKKSSKIIESIFQLYYKAVKIDSASSPIVEFVSGIAIAGIIWYGGHQVMQDETTLGAFTSFLGALMMAYRPLKALSNINNAFQEALAAISRFYQVIDTEPFIRDTENATELNAPKADIALDNVQFSYHKTSTALNNISLHAKAGECIALVGPSGGGKSTIMNMIQRFYDPNSGALSINNQDIKHLTLASLRKHMAVVNQEATLFDDTIRANIAYGKSNATEEEIIEAAKAAAAHEFILEQPNGYETEIGQRGTKLSGGQRQRIAIARAMLRNAPILLLDEATSALDSTSEHHIQQALETLMKGRTTIVIAHRLSTIQHADRIYVIDQGEISESGNHKELLKQKGLYAELYETQFKHSK